MNYKKGTQTRGCMKSVMRYVSQLSKTLWDGQPLVSGIGCQPETAFDEFLSTKLLHHKDGGVMFYHMVQSFPKGANIDPRTAHEAARRLAGYFDGCAPGPRAGPRPRCAGCTGTGAASGAGQDPRRHKAPDRSPAARHGRARCAGRGILERITRRGEQH